MEERIRSAEVEEIVRVVEELGEMIAAIPENVMRAVDESKRGSGLKPKRKKRDREEDSEKSSISRDHQERQRHPRPENLPQAGPPGHTEAP